MNLKDVENLAELARINLTQVEKEKILKDMESILDYVKQVEAAEVKDEDRDTQMKNSWREDVFLPRDFSRDGILEQFPEREEDNLKVKKSL